MALQVPAERTMTTCSLIAIGCEIYNETWFGSTPSLDTWSKFVVEILSKWRVVLRWWPPLWSSSQSSWLQIQRPWFDSRHYQKQKVVGLERDPLSLVSTTEELLDRKVADPVKKTENTAVGIRHADHVAPSIRKSWQLLRLQAAVTRSV
jgi:hypothetical protein